MTSHYASIGIPAVDTKSALLLKRVAREFLWPYRWRWFAALIAMLLTAIATMSLAKLIQPLIDDIFNEMDRDLILPVIAGMVGAFVVRGAAGYVQSVLADDLGQRLIVSLRQSLFRHLMGADQEVFDAISASRFLSHFINDIDALRELVAFTISSLIGDTIMIVFLVGFMIWQDPVLALIYVFALPFLIFPNVLITRRSRRLYARMQERTAVFAGLLGEVFHGIRQVRASQSEAYEIERMDTAVEDIRRLYMRRSRNLALLHPILEGLAACAVVGVVLYGVYQVQVGAQTPGSFMAFFTAMGLAFPAMKRLGQRRALMQEGLAAVDRVFAVLDTNPAITAPAGAPPLAISNGEIRLDNVCFSYVDREPALRGVTLTVPARKTVALVGLSGSGKSTILSLILRFYDPQSGAVLIDGQDIRNVRMDSLRAAIAYVGQDYPLFDDTVRANIAYGLPQRSEDEIMEAARDAGALNFVNRMPDRMDTKIGPLGVQISGGERQRLSIARAFLRDAPILLLDEPTSALDPEAEDAVRRALERLKVGRTVLVVAHRLSTVRDADLIHVLDQGLVIESGTHDELLRRGGRYAELARFQLLPAEGDPSPSAHAHRDRERA